jgi:hypothetical protein
MTSIDRRLARLEITHRGVDQGYPDKGMGFWAGFEQAGRESYAAYSPEQYPVLWKNIRAFARSAGLPVGAGED